MANAEIISKAAKEQPGELALAQIATQAGRSDLIIFLEGRVGVDVSTETFTENEFSMRNFESRVEGSSGAVLETVLGPKRLRPIGCLDHFEGLLVHVGRSERDVVRWVPILSEKDVVEPLAQGINERNNGICFWNG